MKVAFFETRKFEKTIFEKLSLQYKQTLTYFEPRLTEDTVALARGFSAICSNTNDHLNKFVLTQLREVGVSLIALRSAGFNHVDLPTAVKLGLKVVRVPAYSPYSVAEYAATMLLSMNRKICKASTRVHELNFSLDGLVGFDLNGKTIGIVGTGRIGAVLVKIMTGFGCRVLAFDVKPDHALASKLDFSYVTLDEILRQSDVISLHVPLSASTQHLINADAIAKMKKGVMLINTGRGALVDTQALIHALKSGQISAAGLDVYEEEESIFSRDLSADVLQDDVLARLMTFPNVLITAHQAFLTHEALHNIADTTLQNIREFESGLALTNSIS